MQEVFPGCGGNLAVGCCEQRFSRHGKQLCEGAFVESMDEHVGKAGMFQSQSVGGTRVVDVGRQVDEGGVTPNALAGFVDDFVDPISACNVDNFLLAQIVVRVEVFAEDVDEGTSYVTENSWVFGIVESWLLGDSSGNDAVVVAYGGSSSEANVGAFWRDSEAEHDVPNDQGNEALVNWFFGTCQVGSFGKVNVVGGAH